MAHQKTLFDGQVGRHRLCEPMATGNMMVERQAAKWVSTGQIQSAELQAAGRVSLIVDHTSSLCLQTGKCLSKIQGIDCNP